MYANLRVIKTRIENRKCSESEVSYGGAKSLPTDIFS